jgi:hypothetical protein
MFSQTSESVSCLPEGKQPDLNAVMADVHDWLGLIRAEYFEMPCLHLTRNQFQRLWNLDKVTCDWLLQALVDEGFLRLTEAGAYVRL